MPDSHNVTNLSNKLGLINQNGIAFSFYEDELKRAAQLSSFFADEAKKIEEAFSPFRGIIKQLAEQAVYAEQVKQSLVLPDFAEMFKPLTDATNLFQNAIASQHDFMDHFKGMLIDLSPTSYIKHIDLHTTFELQIKAFQSIDRLTNTYSLSAEASEVRQHDGVEFRHSATLELRLSSIEEKVARTDQNTLYLVKDSLHKEELIEGLLQYIQEHRTGLAKIDDIHYIDRSATLMIDGKIVQLTPGTKQSDLCSVIFRDKESLQRTWHFDDIVEAIGEDSSNDRLCRNFYDVARAVSSNIRQVTLKPNFFITTTSTVTVNPEYLG